MKVREELQRLAALSAIDIELHDLREELGDLPFEVEQMEEELAAVVGRMEETEQKIKDLVQFRTDARISTKDMEERVKKLAEQQFQARNNKEFDAITKEIENLQRERRRIEEELGSSNLTEENLKRTRDSQEAEFLEAKERLAAKERELKALSSDQNEEMAALLKQRDELLEQLTGEHREMYERIRSYHYNPVVRIHKGSCSGCYNFVPPQRIVEMRKYRKLEICENCGRLMYPEEMEIPAEMTVS